MAGGKVRVLVVDDSSLIRAILISMLRPHPQIEVVGQAKDGIEALAKIKALRPDVVTLDVEMPRLNGIGVLERVPDRLPISFLMVSTLTRSGGLLTTEALRKGAFAYITKPQRGFAGSAAFRADLFAKVLAAAAKKNARRITTTEGPTAAPTIPPVHRAGWLVAIGISCGGPQTLMQMLPAFPSDFPPILITQHMPAEFTGAFAKHLDGVCSMNVREAAQGDRLEAGTILIAPGDQHLRVGRQGVHLVAQLDSGPKISGHRPSVDALFESVAAYCGPRSVGVIMTGMGRDGAEGMGLMQEKGAWTLAQNETTSLVYGMPKAAFQAGVVDRVVGLPQIPLAVARLIQTGAKAVEPV